VRLSNARPRPSDNDPFETGVMGPGLGKVVELHEVAEGRVVLSERKHHRMGVRGVDGRLRHPFEDFEQHAVGRAQHGGGPVRGRDLHAEDRQAVAHA
jgi:hypothetical protein